MSNALVLQNVSKRYVVYDSNLRRFASWFFAGVRPTSEFQANQSVSFKVKRGEALALIGQNGAGKSTLLKMITGTVRPSTGTISVAGRVSAILELGIGFNSEFTGRENVFHAGGLMGLSQGELTRLSPGIEAFAELGEHFDHPMRTYSTGMHARLAFALATARRPDVLIVDEVLSVGDSYFQHKSFNRIRQFKEDGTSIILVTHGLADVRALCDRVILLDKGKIIKDGLPDEVVDYYNAMIAERENAKLRIEQRHNEQGWLVSRSGNYKISIQEIELVDAERTEVISTARVNQNLTLRIVAKANEPIPNLVLGIMLRDRLGHVIWGSNTWHMHNSVKDVAPGQRVLFEFHFKCALGPGSYSITTALTSTDTHLSDNYEWFDNNIVFDVLNTDLPYFIGSTFVNAKVDVVRLSFE